MQLVHWVRHDEQLALSMADFERARPLLREDPYSVALWAIAPLFEDLFIPLKIRSSWGLGIATVEKQVKLWQRSDPLYDALGIDPRPVSRFRPGTGWATHTSETIIALRRELAESWAVAERPGERYRAYRVGQLVERYYAKAKNGQATRKQVLNSPLSRTLTAYFGGDWLAFVDYLGEDPHHNEAVITALPKTTLVVGGSARAADVAAKHGLPAREVQRMLAAFWQRTELASPVEERVSALQRYWTEFDSVHAEHTDQPPPRELVQQTRHSWSRNRPADPSTAHRTQFSDQLNLDVQRLWGTTLMPRWPDRLATEPDPHLVMAETLGPALKLWHELRHTVSYISAGSYFRTDLAGLAAYYEPQLQALASLGCPVDLSLFTNLLSADAQDAGSPSRRRFDVFSDIITRHRRSWTSSHYDRYLRERWQGTLRSAAEAYHRKAAQRSGRPPTVKQFAPLAVSAANQWFGGDLAGVYTSLSMEPPMRPTYTQLLYGDPHAFCDRVWNLLNHRRYPDELLPWKEENEEVRRGWNALNYLVREAPAYVQLLEASGATPEPKQLFKWGLNKHLRLGDTPEQTWAAFGAAIQDALTGR